MTQLQIQEKIAEIIHRKDPQAKAYLFGSRARGDSRNNSDWDILILVDGEKVSATTEDKFRDELYELELNTGQIISSFIYTKHYWKTSLTHSPLYKNIHQDGIAL